MSSEMEKDTEVEIVRHFYRAASPTNVRQENRIRELEELLDIERQIRVRLERTNAELADQVDSANERIGECGVSVGHYNDALKKRDMEIQRLRREFDQVQLLTETSNQEGRRRTQQNLLDLQTEVDEAHKQRARTDREKQAVLKELEATLVMLDTSNKARGTAESRLEGLDSALARARQGLEETERQLREVTNTRGAVVEENLNLSSGLKEAGGQVIGLRKAKTNLEGKLEEAQKLLEEAVRAREIQQSQLHQLQGDNEQLRARNEDDYDQLHRLQAQVLRLQTDLTSLRSRHDKEINEKTEEFDELRRKTNTKIAELNDEITRERSRVSSLEKVRQQLTMELDDLHAENQNLSTERDQLVQNIKSLEALAAELEATNTELTNENVLFRANNTKLSHDVARLRRSLDDEEKKNAGLAKENAALTSELQAELEALHAAERDVAQLSQVKAQLEADRAELAAALDETREHLQESEHKLQSAHALLVQMKADTETRLREKNEELETLRRNTQRTIEELTNTIGDLEARFKSETSRLKKKFDVTVAELQDCLAEREKDLAAVTEELRESTQRLTEVENCLDDERRENSVLQEKIMSTERRRVQLQGDLDDTTRLLEAAEKSRRHLQTELEEVSLRVAESAGQINSLSNDKRRLEADLATARADLDDLHASNEENADRAGRLASEIGVMEDDLRQTREELKKSEVTRKSAVNEAREARQRVEERESAAARDVARVGQAGQDRARELETELETERARAKEAQAALKRHERTLRELQQQADEEHRVATELQQMLDSAQAKIRTCRRQVDELETVSSENLNKYKRAQKQIDEAEHRATLAERRLMTMAPSGSGGASSSTISSYSSYNISSPMPR